MEILRPRKKLWTEFLLTPLALTKRPFVHPFSRSWFSTCSFSMLPPESGEKIPASGRFSHCLRFEALLDCHKCNRQLVPATEQGPKPRTVITSLPWSDGTKRPKLSRARHWEQPAHCLRQLGRQE